ncbi:MAG: hypothetical protein KDD58_09185 [Bdellovibrionales bacterium]|nr:hypothetical protein [Bdellovibrionales bacterium]
MLFLNVLVAILISQFGFAESEHHHHAHHPKNTSNKLKLNHGEKWSTDQTLRTNMSAIHDQIKGKLKEIHSNRMTVDQYKELGKKIKSNTDDIFKNCKLKPDADAQLHIVLSDMLSANSKLLENNDIKEKRQAIDQILANYKTYTKYFDHKSDK